MQDKGGARGEIEAQEVAHAGLFPFGLREMDLIRLEAPVSAVVLRIAVQNEAVLTGRCVDPVAVVAAGRVEVEEEDVPCPLESQDLGFIVLVSQAWIP